LHRKLLTNAGSNVSVLLVRVVITFVMTPVYLRVLGVYDYGIWEILVALTGYMGILDIGIKPTVGRFVARFHALEDPAETQRVFSTATLTMLLIGLLGGLLLLGGSWAWFTFFAPAHYEPRYAILLSLVAITLLAQFLYLVVEGALEGFQSFLLKNLLSITMAITIAVIILAFIDRFDGLLLLAAVTTTASVAKYFIGAGLLGMRRFGGLRFALADCSLEVFRRSFRFGIKSFVQGVASRIHLGSDRIIIGLFLGPAMVPFYAIPANLTNYFRNFGWTMTDVFMPLFSSLDALEDQETMRRVYLVASRYCVGLLLPMAIGAVLVGGPFIGIWLGNQYQAHAWIVILLLVSFNMLPFLNPFSTRYLTATGNHGLLARLYPVAALLNIIFSILLVQRYGVAGVALGTLLPMFLVMPIVLRSCCRGLGITVFAYIRHAILPALFPSLVMLLAVLAYGRYTGLTSYGEIGVAVILGAVAYCAVFVATALETAERNWLFNRVRIGLRRVTG